MGRRALRKIDPDLDLSRYLLTIDQLPSPWEPCALFDRPAPLELEIGSGKGLFLESASGERAEHNFLGIEIAGKYARYCAARLAKRERCNAAIIHGDAAVLVRELLPDDSVVAVHVYFPDPWWKKRHRRRRVMNETMVRQIERILSPGGILHFWTDVDEYFQSTCELLKEATALTGPIHVATQPAEHDLDYRTHFERRMRLNEEPVYRAAFCKAK